ncbi:MAG TPA: DUF3500 domain-containing protein [Pirellulales bacterium]|jgi:hypothetical protein|nr:DUF3500 domain-containing protein [Pirellulales bacterium]
MTQPQKSCPDCDNDFAELSRRVFLKTTSAAAVAASILPNWAVAKDLPAEKGPPETLVKKLYDSLGEKQRKEVAFDWDFVHPEMGLLRSRVSNNWHITQPQIAGEYYTKDQQELIRAIFEGVFTEEWVKKLDKQLTDDAGGYGKQQNIALFGKPGDGKFEFVMTGRHLTMRVDGHSNEHAAFGGPIFHGHAASGFNEKPDHPGNVFWPQALAANKIFEMLDGKQRKTALVARTPAESAVGFRGEKGEFPGIAVTELSSDQKEQLQKTMQLMLDPYRKVEREDVLKCLKSQGGLDKCGLAFYSQGDLGDDGVWDNWRLEGPSFIWYFRGAPHVHLWINIADDATLKTNAQG